MASTEQLLSEFKRWAYLRGSTPMFCRRTALDIIDRCEDNRFQILGIDGMYLGWHATHSPIELIYHPSEAGWTDYEAARRYLGETAHLPLFYELVIRDPERKPAESGDSHA